MTKKEAINWYDGLPDDVRMKLQLEFGNDNIPNRETKFYNWLSAFTKTKQKEYFLNSK